MKRSYKTYDVKLKAKVALEALTGKKEVLELSKDA